MGHLELPELLLVDLYQKQRPSRTLKTSRIPHNILLRKERAILILVQLFFREYARITEQIQVTQATPFEYVSHSGLLVCVDC